MIVEKIEKPTHHDEPQEGGTVSLADIDQLLEAMQNDAHADPCYFYISIEIAKRIWRFSQLAKLDAANPLPQRKLRKHIMRKIYARRRKGRERIARLEQIRDAREAQLIEEMMRQGQP